ncbi:HAMP domain-containing protein [bacterium]|nr:HAMP domain-containing protein [bacterium]
MKRRRFLWQLFPLFLLIILLSLTAVMITVTRSLRDFHLEQRSRELREKAHGLEERAAVWAAVPEAARRDSLCRAMGDRLGARITLIAAAGVVLGDSRRSSATMDNHAGREEVAAALEGRVGSSVRYSHTVKYNSMYLAVPLPREGTADGVLRLSVPLDDVAGEARRLTGNLLLEALAVALLAALISLFVARRFSRRLERLRRGAERFADGDLQYRLPQESTTEIADLADGMNTMAGQLAERIATVQAQHRELAAVFSSMIEGVLVVDDDQRVVSLNDAAAGLLGLDRAAAEGAVLEEISRHPALARFIRRARMSLKPVEEDIALLSDDDNVFLQAHGLKLEGSARAQRVLIVLNDVTRLRKLEQVRQDFVANVSHELKTPVTSIMGFVDTLRDGAIDEPENAQRFLDIISRQSYRLQAIIEDLLCLSRLEQGSGAAGRDLGVYGVSEVLGAAVQSCQVQADARSMTLRVDCDPGLRTRLDPDLMEQALVNLIANAIKYNDEPGVIDISAAPVDDHVLITVRDRGRGIESQHLPRLFERFYRVDKARSREQGGTGLGLAIVKHIARFHDGQVTAMSRPGGGSQFTIPLPHHKV